MRIAPNNITKAQASPIRALALLSIGLVLGLVTASAPAAAAESRGFGLDVLVSGYATREYPANGTLYIEAERGRDYALRLTNPYPYRVAVALSVDGLNTIDARRTDAQSARKWVLDPYETVTISGFQVSGIAARRFTFTGERSSYGAALGETQNLGVIEAAFFRERVRRPRPRIDRDWQDEPFYDKRRREGDSDAGVGGLPGAESAPAPRESAAQAPQAPNARPRPGDGTASQYEPSLSDEYAATRMGERTRHEVTQVHVDLEPSPSAVVRIRYEFRPQLVRLGIFPPRRHPMDRRERATGFDRGFSPEVDRW